MRIKFIIFVFVATWLALIVRVFYLSIESNSYYSKLSTQNTIKHELIAPVRGTIVDRHNRPLAINNLGFKISLAPHLRSKKMIDQFHEELDLLLALLPSLDKEEIIKNYIKKDSYYNHNFIEVVKFIPYEEMMPVYTQLNLRENILISPSPKRYYPYKNLAAHMIGYVGRANQRDIENDELLELIGSTGKTGVEKFYNQYLQGEPGYRQIKVNAKNLEVEELSYKEADENREITLGIDIELQKYISELFEGKVGSVVVMDMNGSILSAGSFPNYDLNIFVSGMSFDMYNKLASSLDHPFTNKLIHGLYPPGSTIKPMLGLLFVTTELNEDWSVNCQSSLPLGGRIFRCWRKRVMEIPA